MAKAVAVGGVWWRGETRPGAGAFRENRNLKGSTVAQGPSDLGRGSAPTTCPIKFCPIKLPCIPANNVQSTGAQSATIQER